MTSHPLLCVERGISSSSRSFWHQCNGRPWGSVGTSDWEKSQVELKSEQTNWNWKDSFLISAWVVALKRWQHLGRPPSVSLLAHQHFGSVWNEECWPWQRRRSSPWLSNRIQRAHTNSNLPCNLENVPFVVPFVYSRICWFWNQKQFTNSQQKDRFLCCRSGFYHNEQVIFFDRSSCGGRSVYILTLTCSEKVPEILIMQNKISHLHVYTCFQSHFKSTSHLDYCKTKISPLKMDGFVWRPVFFWGGIRPIFRGYTRWN